jgi:hypothetical protein
VGQGHTEHDTEWCCGTKGQRKWSHSGVVGLRDKENGHTVVLWDGRTKKMVTQWCCGTEGQRKWSHSGVVGLKDKENGHTVVLWD